MPGVETVYRLVFYTEEDNILKTKQCSLKLQNGVENKSVAKKILQEWRTKNSSVSNSTEISVTEQKF